jgi:glycosyltransferase involved in cell wall biosynthesis
MTPPPLRVLVVHNRYRSALPSGEDGVVDQELALLADAGHDVSSFERRSDDIAGMPVLQRAMVPLRVPWNAAVRTELTDRLRREGPDVVHVHNTFPLISPAVVTACRDAGVPLVATLHNYMLACAPGSLFRDGRICTDCVGASPWPGVRHGCYRQSSLATVPMVANLLVNRRRWWSGVTRFFCISTAQRDILRQAGLPQQRVIVKHNFVPDPGRLRTGPGEHLLYVGRLSDEKGIPLLMSAWERLAATGGVGVPLVVAGAGPLQDTVARWAEDRADVHYLGRRSRSECSGLMRRAVAVVTPSNWLEAFGLVVVEAMAVGVPPVVAGHGGLTELVQDGVTGLVHRPGDEASLVEALRRIARETDRNREMGHAARRRYERDFTPAVGLARLVDGYQEAISAAEPSEPGRVR